MELFMVKTTKGPPLKMGREQRRGKSAMHELENSTGYSLVYFKCFSLFLAEKERISSLGVHKA